MKETTKLDKLQSQTANETALLIYYYNDDCPPCISLRPKVEAMVNTRFEKMKIAWVNSKTHPEVPAHYNVFANPTILIFFEGKEFKRYSKYVSISELEQAISRYYDLIFN